MSTELSRLEEALLAFTIESTHDRATLERYLNEYPEHAIALVDCSIELMMDTARSGDEVNVSADEVVDQSWQQFQSAVESTQSTTAIASPFAQLTPTEFKSMATKLSISVLFLIRVRERSVDAVTIPRRFVQRLAAELGTTADAVLAYLRSPPTVASNQSFRSDVKPEVPPQIPFEKALETSQLTPAQKEALQALRD
jgi:hypothetical protein